ncbi:hypothetical protein [Marinivivus vitaminiproducens]|uniref:hypothetical protein n=1 Tax=Marinivivus vitaminiproducens TaxID=3035935 RepID=UPI0027A448C2|nr:hypothetical protein P4R82_06955 [Geminicoccaceae bacterium SCSIO 64248]
MSAKPARYAETPNEPEAISGDDALLDLGRAFIAQIEAIEADAAALPAVAAGGEGLVLELTDMVSDSNGEIVLHNDAGFSELGLHADVPVVGEGVSPPHQTSGGDDVTGYRFVTFEGGLTLYYDSALIIAVDAPPSEA